MNRMPEVRYYNSEENEVNWVPIQFAEIEVENEGKKLFLSASPAGVDSYWTFAVSDRSIVSILENDPKADFKNCIIEKYGDLEEVLNSSYLYEFISLACVAAKMFGQNTINIV